MLIHSCITVSSTENAVNLFEKCLGLQLLYTFHIPENTLQTLFKVNSSADARVYDAGNAQIEVFIMNPNLQPGKIQHLCLNVPDIEQVIKQAESWNFEIRRLERDNGDIVFLVDADGNLFELKSS